MTEYGRRLVCDRCGREEFLKKLGEKLTDGGFTKCDEYEKYPEDWDKVHGKDLCPVCNDKYTRMIERFYSDLDWDCGVVIETCVKKEDVYAMNRKYTELEIGREV